MKVEQARIFLFVIWIGFFITYIIMCLFSATRDGIGFNLAKGAMWKFVYVLLPIITSFSSFWFLPKFGSTEVSKLDEKILNRGQLLAMFVLTFFTHAIVVAYVIAVFFLTYYGEVNDLQGVNAMGLPPFKPNYVENTDDAVRLLVVLSSVSLLPVGFVLGEKIDTRVVSQASNTGTT